MSSVLVSLVLVVFFPVTYCVARYAGVDQASTDRGSRSTLATLAFTAGSCDYEGKLVYVKGDSLYVHQLKYLPSSTKSASCPFDPIGSDNDVPQLWLVRLSDIKDARIIHYGRKIP
jgi:hypothetical protein